MYIDQMLAMVHEASKLMDIKDPTESREIFELCLEMTPKLKPNEKEYLMKVIYPLDHYNSLEAKYYE